MAAATVLIPHSFPLIHRNSVRTCSTAWQRYSPMRGGSWDDVVKLSVRIQNAAVREILNQRWLEVFPNAEDRPVRQVTVGTTRDHILVQSELTAILP